MISSKKCLIPQKNKFLLFDISGTPKFDNTFDLKLNHSFLTTQYDPKRDIIHCFDIKGHLHVIGS